MIETGGDGISSSRRDLVLWAFSAGTALKENGRAPGRACRPLCTAAFQLAGRGALDAASAAAARGRAQDPRSEIVPRAVLSKSHLRRGRLERSRHSGGISSFGRYLVLEAVLPVWNQLHFAFDYRHL